MFKNIKVNKKCLIISFLILVILFFICITIKPYIYISSLYVKYIFNSFCTYSEELYTVNVDKILDIEEIYDYIGDKNIFTKDGKLITHSQNKEYVMLEVKESSIIFHVDTFKTLEYELNSELHNSFFPFYNYLSSVSKSYKDSDELKKYIWTSDEFLSLLQEICDIDGSISKVVTGCIEGIW